MGPTPEERRPDSSDDGPRARRLRMVEHDIVARGVTDERVAQAMRIVPRERFVSGEFVDVAYADQPLRIGEGQTISQPFMVATMAEAAQVTPHSRVLEIGTGSGYGAAVLSCIAAEVWSVERHEALADSARIRLAELGHDNVHVVCGDGTLGWPEAAPFDAIVATANAPSVPTALIDQLVVGGRLIIPVGPDSGDQHLLRVRRLDDGIIEEDLGAVRFVPLIGEQGWEATTRPWKARRASEQNS